MPSDLIEPVTTISLNGTLGQNGWYRSNVQATISASDDGGSGVAGTEYSLDGGLTWTSYSTPLNFTTEGITQLHARSWDDAGNVEAPPAASEVKIDKTPPVGTAISLSGTFGENNWYISDVQVSILAGSDDGCSGVAGTEYSLDGGLNWTPYSTPFNITTEGIIQLRARSWDNAGNVEAPPDASEVKIDKTAPTATESVSPATIKNQRKGTMVNVTYTGAAQDFASGIYSTSTILIDEYGELSTDLGSGLSGVTEVEAWCDRKDRDGRHYTFRLTVCDYAGLQTITESEVIVSK